MMLRTSKKSKKKSSRKGAKQILHKTSITLAGEKVNMSIKEKLTAELTDAKLGKHETVVKNAVMKTICKFCKQNAEFKQAIEQSSKSFADCLKATVKAYLATAIDAAKRLCEFIGNNSTDSNHDLFVSKAKQFFEKMTEDIA